MSSQLPKPRVPFEESWVASWFAIAVICEYSPRHQEWSQVPFIGMTGEDTSELSKIDKVLCHTSRQTHAGNEDSVTKFGVRGINQVTDVVKRRYETRWL